MMILPYALAVVVLVALGLLAKHLLQGSADAEPTQTNIEPDTDTTPEPIVASDTPIVVSATEADDDFDASSLHTGKDWGEAGYGPNRQVDGSSHTLPKTGAKLSTRFVMDAKVAQRFNAHAVAAWPAEIGGLLKLDDSEPGVVRVVDMKIFAHKSANGAYFELDELDVAKFIMGLDAEGRGNEIPQWRSLIHSHPNMNPFLSGTDRDNITRLAGPNNAWSVICSASNNPDHNWYAVHYAQGGPVKLVIQDLKVEDEGHDLSGVALLSDEEIETIENDVVEAMKAVAAKKTYTSWGGGPTGWGGGHWGTPSKSHTVKRTFAPNAELDAIIDEDNIFVDEDDEASDWESEMAFYLLGQEDWDVDDEEKDLTLEESWEEKVLAAEAWESKLEYDDLSDVEPGIEYDDIAPRHAEERWDDVS